MCGAVALPVLPTPPITCPTATLRPAATATDPKRPVFKQLLAYLKDSNDIDYVIVYMRSRAFRNSTDAGITKRALSLLGIRIVSCKEDFGQRPRG